MGVLVTYVSFLYKGKVSKTVMYKHRGNEFLKDVHDWVAGANTSIEMHEAYSNNNESVDVSTGKPGLALKSGK